MIPTSNTDIFLGLLTILMSFWMILWSMQSSPSVQKWAKIVGGVIIVKVAVFMVMQLFCASCKQSCPIKHKGMQGPPPMHQNQPMTPPPAPTTGS